MIAVAALSSAIRTLPMSALTSGVSMAGLRMSPSSPPVQHTRTVRTPSAWYRATVLAPLEDSSSGWACTESRQRRSGTAPTLAAPGRRAAVAPRPPLGLMLGIYGRHVAEDQGDIPGEGQQGVGQGRRPPRHARSVLRAATAAAPEDPAQRGRRGHRPEAHRVAGPGPAKAGRQTPGPGQGGIATEQRGPGPRSAGPAGRTGRAADRPQGPA